MQMFKLSFLISLVLSISAPLSASTREDSPFDVCERESVSSCEWPEGEWEKFEVPHETLVEEITSPRVTPLIGMEGKGEVTSNGTFENDKMGERELIPNLADAEVQTATPIIETTEQASQVFAEMSHVATETDAELACSLCDAQVQTAELDESVETQTEAESVPLIQPLVGVDTAATEISRWFNARIVEVQVPLPPYYNNPSIVAQRADLANKMIDLVANLKSCAAAVHPECTAFMQQVVGVLNSWNTQTAHQRCGKDGLVPLSAQATIDQIQAFSRGVQRVTRPMY